MKQVDFYLLKNAVNQGRFKLASRLANKIQTLHKKSLIVLDDQTALNELDTLLWSFSDTSFVAHARVSSEQQSLCSTHLAQITELGEQTAFTEYDVLINLSSVVPPFSHHFARTIEVVESDEHAKTSARERFRHYKTEGFDLKTHDIEL